MKNSDPRKQPWYQVVSKKTGQSEILIFGSIGPSWWDDESVTAKSLIAELDDIGDEDITVRINSLGGSVADGIAIFNALRRHKGKITTSVEGVAYSAGSLIAMAGEDIDMAENSMLMIHAPASYASGNAVEMRRQADLLDKYADAMTLSYVRAGGPDKTSIEGWMKDGEDHYFTATEAESIGLIDTITGTIDATACARGMDFTGYRPLKSQPLTEPQEVPEMAQKTTPTQKTDEPTAPDANGQVVAVVDKNADVNALAARNTEINAILAPHKDVDGVNALLISALSDPKITAADVRRSALDLLGKNISSTINLDERNTEINAILAPHKDVDGVNALLISALSDPKITAADVRRSALDLLGKNISSVSGGPPHIGMDERDKRVEAACSALMSRGNVRDESGKIIDVNGNPFRGMTLLEMARASLAKSGIDTAGRSKLEVVGLSFTNSSSDFPVILENIMHKTLLSSYSIAPDTWSRCCAIGSVSDFRAHNRYYLGGIGNLSPINEFGEFETKDISDGGREKVSIETKGNLVGISRQAIIDDDLGAFVGLAHNLGRSAKRTIEADFYKALAMNDGAGPFLTDSTGIFTAGHKNIITVDGIPSVTLLEKGILLMSEQVAHTEETSPTDTSDYDYLDISPKIWLGHKSMETTAVIINTATKDPSASGSSAKNQNTPNPYHGLFDDIVGSARVRKIPDVDPVKLPWYIFADPQIDPVIEISFLDGDQEPFLEMKNGWSVDGVQWKVRLDYGVSAVGSAGAVRFNGV